MAEKWDHDKLAEDLAGHLRSDARMVWQNLQMGPSGSPRPDVYTITKSFASPKPTAYECKVSVSDFRSDVTAGKWMSYLSYAGAVVFAVPAGLVSKADIPPSAGLIVRGPKGWRYAKKATRQVVDIPQAAWLKLLIDGVTREGPVARMCHGRSFVAERHASRLLGEAIASQLVDAHYAERTLADVEAKRERIIADARRQAQRDVSDIMDTAPQQWADLLAALELPADAPSYRVAAEVRNFKRSSAGRIDVTQIEGLASRLQGAAQRLVDELQAAKAKGEE